MMMMTTMVMKIWKSKMSVLNIQTRPSIRYDFKFMTRKISWNLESCEEAVRPIPVAARQTVCSCWGSESRRGYGLLSCVLGRHLCDGQIPRPEESYECVCHWVWTSATITLSSPPIIRQTGVRMRKEDERVTMKNLQLHCNS